MGPIAFDEQDAKMIEEMAQEGCEVYFQPVPDDKPIPWSDVKRKHYPDL